MLLSCSEWRPEITLNILQRTGWPLAAQPRCRKHGINDILQGSQMFLGLFLVLPDVLGCGFFQVSFFFFFF